jgi:hypothetical protein
MGKTELIHSFLAIGLALILYCINSKLASDFFLASFIFNIYLRLLKFGFTQKNSLLTSLVSGLRAALAALALWVSVVKFNLSLTGILIAFLLYIVVLLAFGFHANRRPNN